MPFSLVFIELTFVLLELKLQLLPKPMLQLMLMPMPMLMLMLVLVPLPMLAIIIKPIHLLMLMLVLADQLVVEFLLMLKQRQQLIKLQHQLGNRQLQLIELLSLVLQPTIVQQLLVPLSIKHLELALRQLVHQRLGMLALLRRRLKAFDLSIEAILD